MSGKGLGGFTLGEEIEKTLKRYKEGRFNEFVKKEYPDGNTKAVVKGAHLNKTALNGWDTSDIYTDDKGYTMTFTRDSMGELYSISVQVPNGSEMTKYVINQQTLSRYDKLNSMEAGRVMRQLEKYVSNGASIEAIAQDFSSYQRSPYSKEKTEEINIQKSVNDEIRKDYNRLNLDKYGTHTFETISKDFDENMQCSAVGAPTVVLSQNDREASGRQDADISFSSMALISYAEGSKNVSEIRLSTLDFREGISGSPSYNEVLNIETLMKKGYDEFTAQQKLNEVVQQIYDGKPLKEVFISNKQFLTEESEKLFAQNLEKKNRKPKSLNTIRERG